MGPNRKRLEERFRRINEITDREGTGCERLAFGSAEHKAHREFARQAEEGGLVVESDSFGNTFARLEPKSAESRGEKRKRGSAQENGWDGVAPVLAGSHLDTVAAGGCYDGAAGVFCALEALISIAESRRAGSLTLQRPIEVVAWANEEGARFAPAMMGSAVFTGTMSLEEAYRATDRQGVLLKDALATDPARVGQRPLPGQAPHTYIELHIEQGRILEQLGLPVAIVTGVQGQIAADWEIVGREDHAGATPMDQRSDALAAAAQLILAGEDIAHGHIGSHGVAGVATVGSLQVLPGSRNSIPGRVQGTIDIRHPDDATVVAMADHFIEAGEQSARKRGATFRWKELWCAPAVTFDDTVLTTMQEVVNSLGISCHRMVSAAGHDAVHMQAMCPSAMIFVPSRDGISHNPAEYTDPDSLFRGAQILWGTLIVRAGGVLPETDGPGKV